MMHKPTLQLPGILDPRPPIRARATRLASRLPSLIGRRLLLVDNDNMQRQQDVYGPLLQIVTQRLQAQYGMRDWQRLRRPLRSAQTASLNHLANEIARLGVEAVLLALCDPGGTAHTIVLAWELEQLGLPTVTLCTGQALHLAATMSLPVMPGLPLSHLDVRHGASAAEIAAEANWIVGEIVDGLTTAPALLQQQFEAKFAPDRTHLPADAARELHPWMPQPPSGSDAAVAPLTYDPSRDLTQLYETLCNHSIGDGLPVIPPTRPLVQEMLRYCDQPADAVLIPHCFPSGLPLTVQTLAINAVMAGCRADYFPILQTAAQAIAEPPYRLMQGTITSHPAANAILVSGPLAQQIGLASAGGCLGPGFRANMTIGRALTLSLLNVARALPGKGDLSTIGAPAELALCCAEHVMASPWAAFHADQYDADTTTVTVMKCESPHNVAVPRHATPEDLLQRIAAVAAIQADHPADVRADYLLLLNPEHAQRLHNAGWRKTDVQRYLCEQLCHSRRTGEARGRRPLRPAAPAELQAMPVEPGPEAILVFVVGNHGPHSMIGMAWERSRAVTKAVTLSSGEPARRLEDFQRQNHPGGAQP